MELVETNIVDNTLNKLLYQFQESPNYKNLVSIYLTLQTEIQALCFEVLGQKDLNLAEGLSLDLIGKIVGATRDSLPDDLYRTKILIKIFINNSKGRISDIQNIVKLLTNSEQVRVFEQFPASVNLYVSGVALTEEQRQIVQTIVAAGVRVGSVLVAGGREPLIPTEIDGPALTGILPEVGVDLPDTRIPVEETV